MAARFGMDEEDILTDINITPLVDVVLVLLIIFMVTATYIIAPSIPIALPEAGSGEPTERAGLSIALDADSRLYVNGEAADELTLVRTLSRVRAQAQGAEPQAILSADRAVSHGEVIRILDLVKRSGLSRFAIQISPERVGPGLEVVPSAEIRTPAGGR